MDLSWFGDRDQRGWIVLSLMTVGGALTVIPFLGPADGFMRGPMSDADTAFSFRLSTSRFLRQTKPTPSLEDTSRYREAMRHSPAARLRRWTFLLGVTLIGAGTALIALDGD